MKSTDKKRIVLYIIFGLSFIIGLVILVMPLTTKTPEVLEKAPDHTMGFLKESDFTSPTKAPIPDSEMPGAMPGMINELNTQRYAGIIGIFVAFGITIGIGYILNKKRKKSD
jgi:hypothetical protein